MYEILQYEIIHEQDKLNSSHWSFFRIAWVLMALLPHAVFIIT